VVTLTAVPSNGCRFEKWSGDIDANDAGNSTISVVMDRDRTVIADFSGYVGPYDITVNASTYLSGSTTINASFGILTCSATRTSTGTMVNISAVAAEGYRFDGWKGGITGSQANVSFVANSSEPITAEFSVSAPSSFPWGWVAGGIAALLLVAILFARFISGRAKKPDDFVPYS
jgi:hypothetical protein